nr:hypothetical protein [Baekduia soli]
MAHLDGDLGRRCVLGDVGQRLGDDEVGGRLDGLGQAPVDGDVGEHRHGRALGQRGHRRREATVGQDRRVDPAGQLAQLGQRAGEPLAQPVDHRRELRVVAHAPAQQAQLQRERHELLLGAVVQVALDAPARPVGGLHDPQARLAQLLQTRPQVGLQALVVDGQRRRRGRGLHELARRVQRGVVDDGGDGDAIALDGRPGPARLRIGQLDAAPHVVDEHRAVGQPVGDGDRVVAEALGQQLAHRGRRGHARQQQRAARRRQQRLHRLQDRERHDRRRQRQRPEHEPQRGPHRPRPDVVDAAQAADGLHPELEQRGQDDHGRQGHEQQRERQRRPQGQDAHHAPQGAVRQHVQGAPPAAAGRRRPHRQRRDPRPEQAVGRPAVQAHQAAAGRRAAQQQRQPDPGHAQRGPDDQAEHGEHPEHHDRDARGEVGDRLRRTPQPAPEGEVGDHGTRSTTTVPDELRAWMANGASAALTMPRTIGPVPEVDASTR